MASSENVASMMEPWAFRTNTFADSWISETFSRDTKTLTRALQKSLSNNPESLDSSSDMFMPFLNNILQPETAPTPTVSGLSGSEDPDTSPAPPKRQQRNAIPVSGAGGGKVSKRKSRAAKRSQTTFITADPSNFRQMVQQVTGVRFGNEQVPLPSILKPEPQRLGSRLPGIGCCMPTLDTSAFLLEHHNQQQQQLVGPTTMTGAGLNTTLTGLGPASFGQTSIGEDVASAGGVASGGLGFDSFSSFPTLESWKVM
ncbi:calmodulin-binding protein 25-like [Prunus avium]|uniref:Calmodulin-binding protein 25-like n=1 Tax=Prunus avium TaxID=42229 RepID=A0A6P5TD74_PRUAV|nr:calmodulin-binding protein 25-like [Prunus avium]